jgi:hypothetical protein
MNRIVGGALALLVLLPAVRGRDDPQPGTPAEQVKALTKEFQGAMDAYQQALRDLQAKQAKTRPEAYTKRFLDIAEKNPKDPAAVEALTWVLQHTPGRDPSRERAVELLKRDHLESANLAPVFEALSRGYDKASRELALEALKKNPHREVQARACLMLAERLDQSLKMQEQFKERPPVVQTYERILGKDVVVDIQQLDPEKATKEIEEFYEKVADKYADLKDPQYGTLGKLARKKLDTLRHPITIGKPAPDIEGEDVDGKAFKLSDYKGKVVLLDFWGHW